MYQRNYFTQIDESMDLHYTDGFTKQKDVPWDLLYQKKAVKFQQDKNHLQYYNILVHNCQNNTSTNMASSE